MATQELQELGEWTVGKRVVVEYMGTSAMAGKKLAYISRITTGRDGTIYVNDTPYTKEGRSRGGNDSWGGSRIYPATAQDIQSIVVESNRNFFRNLNWDKLSDETILALREAYRLINPPAPKPEAPKV